jgi:hypothetical protein
MGIGQAEERFSFPTLTLKREAITVNQMKQVVQLY